MSRKSQSELYAGADLYIVSRHIVVSGNYPSVMGSKYVERDLHLMAHKLDPRGDAEYWREVRRRPIHETPVGLKWCSHHDPRDNGGWVDRRNFSPDKRNFDGLKHACKDCLAREERRRYALLKEAQGQVVRPYRRKDREEDIAAAIA